MLSGFTKILANTAAQIGNTVQTTVQEVTGPKALADYELGDQIGSGGPGMLWKLYRAIPKSKTMQLVSAEVCVWYLDKKEISESRARHGLPKADEDRLFEILRADAKVLQKLRHPGIVKVMEALDESKGAMAMVTEPVFSSVANALGNLDNLPKVPRELEKLELGQLEIKHGLMQLSETLSFVHRNAMLIHRGICPESIVITKNGGWKFSGFGFSMYVDDELPDDEPSFFYPDYDLDHVPLPLQPPLDYVAPELTRRPSLGSTVPKGTAGRDARASVDIFSLALLAYRLISGRNLIRASNNIRAFHSRVSSIKNDPLQGIPMELESEMRRMLSIDPTYRPTASDFAASVFFTEDMRLKALRFFDEMIGRDNNARIEFLKALPSIWAGFDSRVLRFKVLPPLLHELNNPATQLLALPWVLEIMEAQDAQDFELRTQTLLLPAMEHAGGEVLLQFLQHLPALVSKVSPPILHSHVLPMVLRGFEDPDPRLQEETLRRSAAMVSKLDFEFVKDALVPRVHMLALRTSVAAVRVQALVCLGDLIPSLDKASVMDILQTCARCASVDRSPPTLMCVVAVSDIVSREYGLDFSAEFILPLLCPLLIVQQLNGPQFARCLKLIMDILTKIQDKRGVSLSDGDAISLDLQSMGLAPSSDAQAPFDTQSKPAWSSPSSGGSPFPGPTSPPPPTSDPFALSAPSFAPPPSSTAFPSFGGSPPLAPPPSSSVDPFALTSAPSASHSSFLSSFNPAPAPLSSLGPSTVTSGATAGLSSGFGGSINGPSSLSAPSSTPADDPFADWPPRKPAAPSLPPSQPSVGSNASLGGGANWGSSGPDPFASTSGFPSGPMGSSMGSSRLGTAAAPRPPAPGAGAHNLGAFFGAPAAAPMGGMPAPQMGGGLRLAPPPGAGLGGSPTNFMIPPPGGVQRPSPPQYGKPGGSAPLDLL